MVHPANSNSVVHELICSTQFQIWACDLGTHLPDNPSDATNRRRCQPGAGQPGGTGLAAGDADGVRGVQTPRAQPSTSPLGGQHHVPREPGPAGPPALGTLRGWEGGDLLEHRTWTARPGPGEGDPGQARPVSHSLCLQSSRKP